ncbi:MAG: hypothetical protein EZS28_031113 [Streblomastix strix]|uniref:Uncharacterized protein n=1 Tax=Streblomastix strix TaxID=222440 RepID=A0A5J4UTQ7_9EUKA|nr:MAG: hypothetical protein EZS28_031113 [Streblomastix strix]
MVIQDNDAKLAIGDNLCIVDKQVIDYWRDGTIIRVLETELLDMFNIVTALCTATGGDNAITDISIDANALTIAKNIIFVIIENSQSINQMNIFTNTIISNRIQYTKHKSNSTVIAECGVRQYLRDSVQKFWRL